MNNFLSLFTDAIWTTANICRQLAEIACGCVSKHAFLSHACAIDYLISIMSVLQTNHNLQIMYAIPGWACIWMFLSFYTLKNISVMSTSLYSYLIHICSDALIWDLQQWIYLSKADHEYLPTYACFCCETHWCSLFRVLETLTSQSRFYIGLCGYRCA